MSGTVSVVKHGFEVLRRVGVYDPVHAAQALETARCEDAAVLRAGTPLGLRAHFGVARSARGGLASPHFFTLYDESESPRAADGYQHTPCFGSSALVMFPMGATEDQKATLFQGDFMTSMAKARTVGDLIRAVATLFARMAEVNDHMSDELEIGAIFTGSERRWYLRGTAAVLANAPCDADLLNLFRAIELDDPDFGTARDRLFSVRSGDWNSEGLIVTGLIPEATVHDRTAAVISGLSGQQYTPSVYGQSFSSLAYWDSDDECCYIQWEAITFLNAERSIVIPGSAGKGLNALSSTTYYLYWDGDSNTVVATTLYPSTMAANRLFLGKQTTPEPGHVGSDPGTGAGGTILLPPPIE